MKVELVFHLSMKITLIKTPNAWTYTWIGDQFTTMSAENEDNKVSASQFTLYPNFPNPFNPTTSIQFSLDKDQLVSLNIYNVKGQLVESLINKQLKLGFIPLYGMLQTLHPVYTFTSYNQSIILSQKRWS